MNGKRRWRWFWRGAALIAALLLGATAVAAAETDEFRDSPNVRNLKLQYEQMHHAYRGMVSRQQQLLERQNRIADEIERLQSSDPGVIGRMRLDDLLAQNLEVSRELSDLAQQMTANEKARRAKRDAVHQAYTVEMETIVRQIRQTRDKKKAVELAHKFYELRQRREPWSATVAIKRDFSDSVVEEDELDGPEELELKAGILDDLVGKIRLAVRQLERQINRLKREYKLSNEMDSMIDEMNLFEEGIRFESAEEEGVVGQPDSEDVHLPPLEVGKQPGGEGRQYSGAVMREIQKLEAEKKVLEELAAELSTKAAKLRARADKLRAIEKW